jgi:mono/diheme cytochrome c family protein
MNAKRVTGYPLLLLSIGSAAVVTELLCLPTRCVAAEAENVGKATYTQYCSACHGYEGKGNGPVASWLTAKPTDLTQIAKNAGGEFPMIKVIQAIDGTATVRGHGDSDMPVWGDRFRADGSASLNRQARMRGKILLITDYLRSIQVK